MEVKPYVLDDQMCDECQGQRCSGKFAPFFCANVTCLQVIWALKFNSSLEIYKLSFFLSVLLRTLLGNNSFTSWTRVSQAIGKRRSWSSTRSSISLVLSSSAQQLSISQVLLSSLFIHKNTKPAWIIRVIMKRDFSTREGLHHSHPTKHTIYRAVRAKEIHISIVNS